MSDGACWLLCALWVVIVYTGDILWLISYRTR
jgi:hypothetical protein